jgi:hypothetical protein
VPGVSSNASGHSSVRDNRCRRVRLPRSWPVRAELDSGACTAGASRVERRRSFDVNRPRVADPKVRRGGDAIRFSQTAGLDASRRLGRSRACHSDGRAVSSAPWPALRAGNRLASSGPALEVGREDGRPATVGPWLGMWPAMAAQPSRCSRLRGGRRSLPRQGSTAPTSPRRSTGGRRPRPQRARSAV